MFDIRPAICRASYPPGALNHTLHVSETDEPADCDGYLVKPGAFIERNFAYYLTQDDNTLWSAQKVQSGIASNWYIASDFPSRDHLLTYLAARAGLFTVTDRNV
jgi:hypothetical protein